MEYSVLLRSLYLRYPKQADNVKVFIEPSICACDKGWINFLGTRFVEVDTPEEADYIPIWLDYKAKCSDHIWSYAEKYPDKCLNVYHFLESVNSELSPISDSDLSEILNMLSSTDWESINLGLTMLRTYYLDDMLKAIVLQVINTFHQNYVFNTKTIIPFQQSEPIEIQNIDIIRFYMLWLHNEFLCN